MSEQITGNLQKKAAFFQNGSFRVSLTPFEIANRIFIPGHRFIAFLRPDIRPWNVTINTESDGKLARKIISVHPDTLKSYFSLYGEENFLFILIDDRQENTNLILHSQEIPKELRLTVFDLSPYFENIKKNAGSLSLMIDIIDWNRGIYKIRKIEIDADESTDEKTYAAEWAEKLEAGFEAALQNSSRTNNVMDIMSDAFVAAGLDSIKNPPLSLEEFFDLSEISDVADIIGINRESPEIIEKKKYIKTKTIRVIKLLTDWLENNQEEESFLIESTVLLEKQVLITKKALISVLEELGNPFLSNDAIDTMRQVISETEQFISSLEKDV